MLDQTLKLFDLSDHLLNELLEQDVLVKGTSRASSHLTNKMIVSSTPLHIPDFSALESRLLEGGLFWKTNWQSTESVAKAFAAGVLLRGLEYDMEATIDFSTWYDNFIMKEP